MICSCGRALSVSVGLATSSTLRKGSALVGEWPDTLFSNSLSSTKLAFHAKIDKDGPDVPFPIPPRGLHALRLGVILVYCGHFDSFDFTAEDWMLVAAQAVCRKPCGFEWLPKFNLIESPVADS